MIKFIGFTPDRHDKFVTFVMLMVGSLVEATWLKGGVHTEVILITGASQEDGIYFSRTLGMANHAWVLKRMAEEKSFDNYYCLHWDLILSLVYIGNYEDAQDHLVKQAYA